MSTIKVGDRVRRVKETVDPEWAVEFGVVGDEGVVLAFMDDFNANIRLDDGRVLKGCMVSAWERIDAYPYTPADIEPYKPESLDAMIRQTEFLQQKQEKMSRELNEITLQINNNRTEIRKRLEGVL